jgi:hypothetical protein
MTPCFQGFRWFSVKMESTKFLSLCLHTKIHPNVGKEGCQIFPIHTQIDVSNHPKNKTLVDNLWRRGYFAAAKCTKHCAQTLRSARAPSKAILVYNFIQKCVHARGNISYPPPSFLFLSSFLYSL